ncbi:YhdP family protein [Kineobactrum salinum]|uniref:TIGR02099 family protein n=1 Tax=Kineobactrum salinum TaxID=2708301 RepID=A0A6C0U3B7_9GAMM|nr:YhdP family protein [Kineobactrum salinum]QIB66581.1 TIGR02099 family protein [Kineobactrum salinum]
MLWRAIVGLIVLLAVYVSCGRLLVSVVGDYQAAILRELNARTPFHLEATRLSAQWSGFSPELVLADLQLHFSEPDTEPLSLQEGRVTLDVWRSLANRSLRVSHLRLQGLALDGELSSDGRLQLRGFGQQGTDAREWLQALLLDVHGITLAANTLELQLPSGERQALQLDLTLSRDGSRRQLRARLLSGQDSQITVLADGLGNPFTGTDYTGEFYVHASLPDLGQLSQLRSLVEFPVPVTVSGSAELEAWLSWAGGSPTVRARFAGGDLRLQGGGWELPLEAVTGAASLQRTGQRWSLYASDLQVHSAAGLLRLPRLQLDLRGDSLRLRTRDLPVSAASEVLLLSGALPPELAEVVTTLAPHGALEALELHLEDLTAPARAWELAASFAGLAVESWRRAPGVQGASGHLQLRPGSGRVLLDSRQLMLDFPAIYREALTYRDVFGSIDLHWDNAGLALHSGLLTATGEEGTARALLGLQIPFADTGAGIEMDLLVGLRDADATYRTRYLPYILDQNLLAWLRDGLGQGHVERGAFLWRGSLKPQAPELRTVQLFFEVRDGQLSYHPDWPELSALDGSVFIDDTNVSVWARQGQLYGAQISHLSAEAWKDAEGSMRLAVAAELAGDAASGLRLVNESPLGLPLDGALSGWEAKGSLQASLDLELALTKHSRPPQVAVRTTLTDATLAIRPGDLALEQVGGIVYFDSDSGFRAEGLAARLWDAPVALSLQQQAPAAGDRSDGLLPGPLTLAFDTTVRVEALQQWLSLSQPLPARGETGVSGSLDFAPGTPPQLNLETQLTGVELALPEPWGKAAPTAQPLQLAVRFNESPLRLQLNAEGLGKAWVDLADGQLQSVSLGLQDEPRQAQRGELRVGGHAALIDVDAWHRLLLEQAIEAPAGDGLQVVVDELLVDSLRVWGQDWTDVMVAVRQQPDHWQLNLETSWLQGEARLASDGASGSLALSFLDLAGLGSGGSGSGWDIGRASELPRLAVTIEELYRAGARLGTLSFVLAPADRALQAQAITGELAGLKLSPENPGYLQWSGQGTELQATLHFDDLGETLAQLGYERILETDSGNFDLNLRWPGSPRGFSLAASHGSLRVAVDEGRFLTASAGASGTLRVVSILNLADIVQRLSLNHMFESGIPFDRLAGELFFHGGEIEVPLMEVEGAATGFAFSGLSEVEQRSLNGELVATLPVARNLPWVTALTAGLPAAAGVFVVSKLFEKQMSQLSSAVYSITGSWDEPQISFDRVFDTDSRPMRNRDATRDEPAAGSGSEAQPSSPSAGNDGEAASSSSRK